MATAKQITEQEAKERANFERYVSSLYPALAALLRNKSDGRVISLPVKDLYETFDVRILEQGVNDERVVSLRDTFSSKAYAADPMLVPPIIVELANGTEIDTEVLERLRLVPNGVYKIPDGRHRHRRDKASSVQFILTIPMFDLTEEERRLI